MRYSLFPLVIAAVCAQRSLASELLPVGRTLQGTPQDGDLNCANVCDDTDELFSDQVQVTEVEAENKGFFGLIINRFDGAFDSGSRFGRLMNGFFNLFQQRQRNKPKYEISTDLLLSSLSNFSVKAKSLAALIRSESLTYAAESDTPDVITSLFDLSAENMESVASVIDPIVDDMRQYETMDLATVSCSIGQLLTHLRDDTLPNIISISEFIYTKSGNEDMQQMYDNYIATRTAPSDSLTDASSLDSASNQCPNQVNGSALSDASIMKSQALVQARVGGTGDNLVAFQDALTTIVALIILFPISFIVSIATLIFVVYWFILSKIWRIPFIPEYDDDGCSECLVSKQGIVILIVLALIASPILIPILIIITVIGLFWELLNPFVPSDQPTRAPVASPVLAPIPAPFPSAQNRTDFNAYTGNVMHYLSKVLESPMTSMVDTLKGSYISNEAEATEVELDCDAKTIICQNNALMTALPP
jgi:hypothetical protein